MTPIPANGPAAHSYEQVVRSIGQHPYLGLPRAQAHVFGWLVVCEPAQQSADQLQAALALSAASVSAATSGLVAAGIATRTTLPADRRTYYALHPDGSRRLLARRLQSLTELRQATDDALAGAGHPGARLRTWREVLARCEAAFSQALTAEPAPEPKRRKGSGKKDR